MKRLSSVGVVNRFVVGVLYLCYALMLGSYMFGQVKYLGGIFSQAFSISLVVLFLICIVNLKNVKRNKVLPLIVLLLFGLFTKIFLDSNIIMFWCLFIVAFRNIELDKTIKYDLIIRMIFLAIVGFLYFHGLTNTNIHYRDGMIRHSMGLSNPNVFSIHVALIASEFLYLRRGKTGILDFLVVVLGELVIWHFANSRTEMFVLVAVFLVFLCIRLWKEKKLKNIIPKHLRKFTRMLITNSFTVLAILAIIVTVNYSPNSMMSSINAELSGRLYRAHNLMDEVGVSPFGYKADALISIDQADQDLSLSLDNTYVYVLLSYGVVGLILMCYLMKKYFEYALTRKDYGIIAVMLVLLLSGLFERSCISLHYNVFLLYFSYMFFDSSKEKKMMEASNA